METNTFTTPHNGNVNEAKDELKTLGSDLNDQTSLESHRKALIYQHGKDLRANHQTWLSRLPLSREDKQMLKLFGEKELEAATIVFDNQNDALRAICASQVSFIKEVVNTMLKTSRSGLQSAAASIFKENALFMQISLTRLSNQFYDLLETMYTEAQHRLPFVQKEIMADIDVMIAKWREDSLTIQNDFSTILNEKV